MKLNNNNSDNNNHNNNYKIIIIFHYYSTQYNYFEYIVDIFLIHRILIRGKCRAYFISYITKAY